MAELKKTNDAVEKANKNVEQLTKKTEDEFKKIKEQIKIQKEENEQQNIKIDELQKKLAVLENNMTNTERKQSSVGKLTGTNKKRENFKRRHEIVLSRIPNEDKLNTEWLKSELKLPVGTKVTGVEELKPTRYKLPHGRKYPTKSMKCDIETELTLEEIFKPEYYPEQVIVDRFRYRIFICLKH